MAYVLDGTTLKAPTDFSRETIETSASNNSIEGRTTKDIMNRKYRYVLVYNWLSASERNDIITIYDKEACVTFEVTETNLTISETEVHVDIPRRNYHKGADYRENFTLILTEKI